MLRRLCARGGLMHGLACRSISSYQSRLAALDADARRALDATRERLKQAVAAAAAAGADGADRPSSAPLPVEEALAVIEMTFDEYGAEPYFGEPVTHLEHALQCAYHAEMDGYAGDVVVAALLHDIGHICAPDDAPHMDWDGGPDVGIVDHETVGGEFMRLLGFSDFVKELVESHVPAKRYLVAVDEDYAAGLAEDSKRSLMFQGGVMGQEEARAFESEGDAVRDLSLIHI